MGERGKLPPSPSHPQQKRDTPLIRGGPSSTVGKVQFPWSIKYSLPLSITCDTPVTRMPLPIKRTNLLQFTLTDQFVQTSAFSLPPNSPPFVASPPQTSLAKSPIPTTASAPMSLSKTALKVTHTFETPLYQELLFHPFFRAVQHRKDTWSAVCGNWIRWAKKERRRKGESFEVNLLCRGGSLFYWFFIRPRYTWGSIYGSKCL